MSKKGKGKAEKTAPEGGDGLTGSFSEDFPIYCTQLGLPAIPVRALDSRCGGVVSGDTSPSQLSSSLCVLVDTEQSDAHSIKTLQLRNVLLDERVLSALSSALEGTQLTTMILWNVGLNDQTLSQLIPLVTSCTVRRLVLDGNRVSPTHIITLLQNTSVEQLSLKCCCLGDAFCAAISSALSGNHSLTILDLSSNQITDEGVGQLAHALRLNRTLLSLGLAGNRIGDGGVETLCQVLVRFPLTKEEEGIRKSLLAMTTVDSGLDNTGRSPSGVSLDKSGRGSRGGGAKGKREQKKEEKEKSGRASVAGKAGKGGKQGGGRKGGSGGKGDEREDSGQVAAAGPREPLIEMVSEEAGQLWIHGNTTLAHLTLSCNRVGQRGVASLMRVLQTQQNATLSVVNSDLLTTDKTRMSGTGVLRVTLEHNSSIPSICDELAELMSLLQSRDPLATPTSPPDSIHKYNYTA